MSTISRLLTVAALSGALLLPSLASARDHGDHGDHGHGRDHGDWHHGWDHDHGRGWGWGRGPYVNFYYGPGAYYGPDYYYGGGYYYGDPYYYGPPRGVYYGRVAGHDGGDDLAAEVQAVLKREGYYHGPTDGDIGAGSRAAIRSYQADHGLTVTGRIDHGLLRSLRLD